ncbi:hypothetical protein [Streptantibioticus silvisoli]|uniref:PLL-like beta propeller domain-containing protein n=1 Tax=Streptantibioticus silvisoli TaxID=2705255 RepID=A0ABT6W774_9ACTN|nr:hypothetical protein [Streptantibioticus silvisoli]MDI5965523.1 hypothetical protein [Streptantibioticus silvisoli]
MPTSTTPGTGWGEWSNLEGQLFCAPVPRHQADGRLALVAVGPRAGIITREILRDGTWDGGWTRISDTSDALSRPATLRDDDGLGHVFFNTGGGTLYGVRQTAVNGGWSGQFATPATGVKGPPFAVRAANGGVHVFYRGTDGDAYVIRQLPDSGGGYSDPVGLGPSATFPSAALDGSGRLVVVLHHADGRLCVRQEVAPGTGDYGGHVTVGTAAETVEAFAVTDARGQVHVFYRSTGGELWGVAQDPAYRGWDEPRRLAGAIVARPTACLGQDGRLNVVVQGDDDSARIGVQTAPGSHDYGAWSGFGGSIGSPAPVVTIAAHQDGRLVAAHQAARTRNAWIREQTWT